MIRSPSKAVVLLVALAALVLAGCDNGDIHSLVTGGGAGPCPVPESFVKLSGATPTVEADGSLTFSASGIIRFTRAYTSTTVVSYCSELSPMATGATAYLPLLDGASSSMSVSVTYPATGQVDLYMSDDNSGVGCGTSSFFDPAFAVGGSVHLVTRLNQTGGYPILDAWILSDPASSPPDLSSNDPAYCQTASSINWVFSTTTDATLAGTNMSVRRYGFGP